MDTYEIVQKHEYQDIYRLDYGILVKVNKFEKIENVHWYGWETRRHKDLLKKLMASRTVSQL